MESVKIKVSEYYKDELFKFMPEDMFDLLDEAFFNKNDTVRIPKSLIKIFTDKMKNYVL